MWMSLAESISIPTNLANKAWVDGTLVLPDFDIAPSNIQIFRKAGVEVVYDKEKWTNKQWQDYTDKTCHGCIEFLSSGKICPNTFHKQRIS